MAYKVYRIRQKTDEGYDIFHIETNTDLVLRFKGSNCTTLEQELITLGEKIAANAVGLTVLDDVQASVDSVDNVDAGKILTIGQGKVAVSSKTVDDFVPTEHSHTLDDLSGTPDRVIIADSTGAVAASIITTAELETLTGITTTGTIQSQLNEKADSDHTHSQYLLNSAIGSTIPSMTDGKIDVQYLPSFVDDVVEGILATTTSFTVGGEAVTPEAGKIYVDTNTNKTYRWSGTIYVEVGGGGVGLGETSATAYRGDRGKIAYDHSQAAHARSDATATEASATNGNIKINGAEIVVYTHPTYAGTKSSNASSPGAAGNFVVISALTLTNGHVSGYTATTVTMPPRPVDISFATTQPTTQQANDLWFQPI